MLYALNDITSNLPCFITVAAEYKNKYNCIDIIRFPFVFADLCVILIHNGFYISTVLKYFKPGKRSFKPRVECPLKKEKKRFRKKAISSSATEE